MNKLTRLRDIVKFAYIHTDFYHSLYDELGICVDEINSIEELPIITPENLLENSDRFKATVPLQKVQMTSGTVSYPKVLFRTKEDFEHGVKNEITLLKWAGVSDSDVVCIAQPFGINGYGELTAAACEKLGIFYVPIGDVNDELLIECIERFGVTVLDITPSRLMRLFNYQELKKDTVRLAMVAGEQINQNYKDYFWENYRVEIINQFGTTECDCLAGEKSGSTGMYCLNNDFIFEKILDKLVVTSLYHHGTPLIRYCIGDYVDLYEDQIIVKNRDEFFQLFDGIKLDAQIFSKIIEANDGIQWQCLIYEVKKKIIIEICYIDSKNFNKSISIKNEIQKSIDFINMESVIDIQCSIVNSLVFTDARKIPRFIDLRNTSDYIRISLLKSGLFKAFYHCLPTPLTEKKCMELISEIENMDFCIQWSLIEFFAHIWTSKARSFLIKMLNSTMNKYRKMLLSQSVRMSKSNDWEVREDAAKIVGMIIKTDFYGLSKWVNRNLRNKNENVRRTFLVGIKYCAQYEKDIKKHSSMLNMLDVLLFDSSRYVLKSFDSFTIGDGFLNICPELVDEKLEKWLQLDDISVNCKIIRTFKSSGGKNNINLAMKYIRIFETYNEPRIKKTLKATKMYLKKYGAEV